MLQAIVVMEIERQPVLIADVEIHAAQLVVEGVKIGNRNAIIVLAVYLARQVWQRKQLQVVERDGIEAAGGKGVIREGRAGNGCAVERAGSRIVELVRSAGSRNGQQSREIAGPLGGRRDGGKR